ncbi:MAG TPA: SpoIID/LytB domain-containing protein [Bacillus sp. (in: firmicutes)]|uniref:SpoIID/LytB domain-containing protein n=1 Tax=Bacillus litorisediminis TaxID=2922713 RepID=UPI001FAF7A48|nr:SpoIID/LytB domain-containing protein [Bacillus litorisediminis]HWO77311.1 SpoIID/LytB domain-containing protein [Bacillus sp. (in: firmicutes)]
MIRKSKITFICFLLLLSLPIIVVQASSDGVPANPINYKTKVTVKLLPTDTFSLSIFGSYQIVNSDNNSLVPVSNPISVKQQTGKIILTVDGHTYSSAKGFKINEIAAGDSNYVKVSRIKKSTGDADTDYRGSFEIKPGQSTPLLFNSLDIETYLKGVVASEMPASWPKEALKAQTVAARSFAYVQMQTKNYLEMTVASQVYNGKSAEHPNTNVAIQETSGVYALYNGKPIDANFHSSSGGHTENSEDVWSSQVPYLRGVEDPYDKLNGNYHYDWSTPIQRETIENVLGLSDSQTLVRLNVTEKTKGGAVQQMSALIYDQNTNLKTSMDLLPKFASTPDRFRSIFGSSLKSIKFDTSTNASSTIKLANGSEQKTDHLTGYKVMKADGSYEYIEDLNINVKTPDGIHYENVLPTHVNFNGDGWGHSIGMSQWGARGMATSGFTYDQILKHYYTGITVGPLQ